jgi:Lar family restriction alleviation protein
MPAAAPTGPRPCPFCGGTKLSVDGMGVFGYRREGRVEMLATRCRGCGASGPVHPRQDQAVAAWDRRPGEEGKADGHDRPAG